MSKYKRPRPLAMIKLGPYPFDIILFNDRQKFDGYREWHTGKRLAEHALSTKDKCNARTALLGGGNVIAVGIFIKNRQSLVHELCHAIISAFEDMHLSIVFDSSEAFTYLLDDMVKKCEKILWGKA